MESALVITFVALAIFILIAWAIAQGIKKFASKYPPAAPDRYKVSGVGGWLLFLILGLMVLGPLMGAGRINSDFMSIESQYPGLKTVAEWGMYKTATWWTFLVLSCISIYGGYGLTTGRSISVVTRAKIILWIIGPLGTLVMAWLLPSMVLGINSVGPQLIGGLIGSVIVAGIWTLYLFKSKRVKATYGNPTAIPSANSESGENMEPNLGVQARASTESGTLADKLSGVLGGAAFAAFIVLGIAQLVAGFIGIEHELGSWWAYGALAAAFFFRFTLPITIGSFFGAMNVWGWHWALAALFAAPGLVLVVPGVLASILSVVKRG